MRTYQWVGWWSPQGSGSMGHMLNLGCWQWVSIEYHSYEFLEGHICVVAYCNVELAVCILFVVWDLYSYPGSVTASFPSSGSGPSLLYNSHHCQIKSANLLEYSNLSITTVALSLSAGSIMILSSSCSDLRACLSVFEMLGFGGFDFSNAYLTFHLSSSAVALGIFKAASSINAIRSK